MAIDSTWSKYISNEKISNLNKFKIFIAAARSILFYGAQIWGFLKYDEVESLFRFFIKKYSKLYALFRNWSKISICRYPKTSL